ncbi:MAG: hypothetical protein P857_41 [Candidatus Xenolissoclinum pacificiensis L6]|uniref:Transposase DDE domain-containing protein n=1 Tax=Candidatus Xenolissoclinum pacificiensis L6 TaxID=1401685 RepID=W2V2B4_9RICK|nr:MAG: hypothetical protein P857_41 [Candidatus Xenolissoclinum pacificiensis L6]
MYFKKHKENIVWILDTNFRNFAQNQLKQQCRFLLALHKVLARWVVERTFLWLGYFLRLSKENNVMITHYMTLLSRLE